MENMQISQIHFEISFQKAVNELTLDNEEQYQLLKINCFAPFYTSAW